MKFLLALLALLAALTLSVPASATATPRLSEAAKIEALVQSVEHLPGAVFIRNGSEYDGKKAAKHLRNKWKYAGDKIQTAEDFIEYCASASSMTGRKYQIRFADGKTIDSAVFFHQQLARLQATQAHAQAKSAH